MKYKNLLFVLVVLTLFGCDKEQNQEPTPVVTTTMVSTQQLEILEENSFSLREYFYTLQENENKLEYLNENQKLVLVNDEFAFEENEYLEIGKLIYVDENLYLLKKEKKALLLESEEYIVGDNAPMWVSFDNDKAYLMGFCNILRYFDREQESGYCFIGPDGGQVDEYDYPSKDELIEYREWYKQNPRITLKKED